MCIFFLTLEHPEYALILCSNRDEFLDRPTTDAHFHSFDINTENVTDHGSVLSGRDEKAGGTWLGLHRSGRFALLTNITEPPVVYSSSRGHLVSSFLLSDSSRPLEEEIGEIIPRQAKFAGFNMLLLAPAQQSERLSFDTAFVSNGGAGGAISSRPLSEDERHCWGFSNGVDGNGGDKWPKVQHGLHSFKALLQDLPSDVSEAELTDRLFEILAWRSPEQVVHRAQLRNTVQVDPIPITVDGLTSANPQFYGTRLSTVVLIRRASKEVVFIERDAWKSVDGMPIKPDTRSERVFRFTLETRDTEM